MQRATFDYFMSLYITFYLFGSQLVEVSTPVEVSPLVEVSLSVEVIPPVDLCWVSWNLDCAYIWLSKENKYFII